MLESRVQIAGYRATLKTIGLGGLALHDLSRWAYTTNI